MRLDGGPPLTRLARSVAVGNVGLLPGGFALLPDARLDDNVLDVGILAPASPIGSAWWPSGCSPGAAATAGTWSGTRAVESRSRPTPSCRGRLTGRSSAPAGRSPSPCVPGALLVRVPGELGIGEPGNWVGMPKASAPTPEVDDMEIKMVLFLPRDAASVPVSRQVLDGCLETLGVTEDTRTDIALALGEACANVVQHAGPGMDYEVLATARDGKCVIEVANSGDRGEAPVPRAPPWAARGGAGPGDRRAWPRPEDHRCGGRQSGADRRRPRRDHGAFREEPELAAGRRRRASVQRARALAAAPPAAVDQSSRLRRLITLPEPPLSAAGSGWPMATAPIGR